MASDDCGTGDSVVTSGVAARTTGAMATRESLSFRAEMLLIICKLPIVASWNELNFTMNEYWYCKRNLRKRIVADVCLLCTEVTGTSKKAES